MNMNMHGRNAAIIAEGAYAVAAATERTSRDVKRDADTFAQREPAFSADPENGGTSVPVTPHEAVVSQSGGIVKEKAGFGVLLERHGGQKGEFIFAMRGTVGDSKMAPDWLSNYQIGMTRGPSGSLVHAGFMAIYEAMRSEVQRMIAGAKPQRIHFVGHSLGGALATLAAVDYAKAGTATTHLYTFGAPRIGSLGLGADITRMIGAERVKRVYSISDPVPMIPLTPFCHAGAGSIGFADKYGCFSEAAHSMKGNYIPRMPATGWPPESRLSLKMDPGHWLTMAEGYSGIGSSMGYFFLAKALRAILYMLAHVVSATVTVGFTLADMLMEAIRSGAAFAARVEQHILKFIKLALRFAGGVASAGLSLAEITVTFLRYVLTLVMRPIIAAAKAAASVIT